MTRWATPKSGESHACVKCADLRHASVTGAGLSQHRAQKMDLSQSVKLKAPLDLKSFFFKEGGVD